MGQGRPTSAYVGSAPSASAGEERIVATPASAVEAAGPSGGWGTRVPGATHVDLDRLSWSHGDGGGGPSTQATGVKKRTSASPTLSAENIENDLVHVGGHYPSLGRAGALESEGLGRNRGAKARTRPRKKATAMAATGVFIRNAGAGRSPEAMRGAPNAATIARVPPAGASGAPRARVVWSGR
jgi:hypothetical protein